MSADSHSLHRLLWPDSIAVIGASPDETKIRGRLLRYLQNNGFGGRIFPINPSHAKIAGLICYPDIAAAAAQSEQRIDVVLIAIPAPAVLAELECCAAAGVRHAVVITSGFAEEGGEHALVQQRMQALARESGMRITGPNGQGFYNAVSHVSATFTPTLARPPERTPRVSNQRVGIVAQSGGVGFALYQHAWRAGLDFSYVITTGNEADVDLAELVEYMVEDDHTRILLLYVETVRNPSRFEQAALRARERGKHLVTVKIGQSQSGQRATASHTASMAGWNVANTAFFQRCGVYLADDLEQALTMVSLLASGPVPDGKRLAIISASGGAGAWAGDTFERLGGEVPLLSEATQNAIQALIPPYGGTSNPIDVTATGFSSGALLKVVDMLLESDEVDAILVVTTLTVQKFVFDRQELSRLAATSRKPLLFYTVTIPTDFALQALAEAGVTTTTNLPATCAALCRLAQPPAQGFVPRTRQEALPAPALALLDQAETVLCEYEAKSMLPLFGIQPPVERLVASEAQALEAAGSLGYPVAMKLQSPDLPHKSDVGGVVLNVIDEETLINGFRSLMSAAQVHCPGERLRGVLLQPMAPEGYELLIGAVRDDIFGPMISVGFGGVAVELYRDVVYRMAPIDEVGAAQMLDELTASALLRGFRGRPAIETGPLVALIAATSQLAWRMADCVDEIEFNPVIVHADNSGLTIADALMRKRHVHDPDATGVASTEQH